MRYINALMAHWYSIMSTFGEVSFIKCSLASAGVLIGHSPVFSNLSRTSSANFSWQRVVVPAWWSHTMQMPRIQLSSPRSVMSYLSLNAALSLSILSRSLDTMVMSSTYRAMIDIDGSWRVNTAWSASVCL